MKIPTHAALCLTAVMMCPPTVHAQDWAVNTVTAMAQTPVLTKDDMGADADDPAIWLSGTDRAQSLVITAVKNGGMRVYGLDGTLIQTIAPHKDSRINNVDVVYGMTMADGTVADLAIASDRGLDYVRAYRIDRDGAELLTEITDPAEERAFPTRPLRNAEGAEDNPVDDQATIYGLTTWHDRNSGTIWVAGTQRHQPVVGLFRLEATENGVRAVKDHEFAVPTTHMGQDLWEESDDDAAHDFSPQFEGMVIDRTTGMLYAGQEDVGIWRVPVAGGTAELLYQTRGAKGSSFFNPDSVVTRDVEGLSLYYAAGGARYLIASSQGGAHGGAPTYADAPYDDSFAVFSVDEGLDLLGSFRVGGSDGIDGVQESDGDDVISVALPGYPNGVFITQDGYAGDLNGLDGETAATNFKMVDWAEIAATFDPPLMVTPEGWDPRG
ncbi:phytase [Falsirhodobacter sp. alg1]|uniref:phytase n=1 Tax=Falsirhodobacter sp. alg1 TaxID=1472418 RepID=UPI0005EFA8DE|nr:phytase [Falsirhodobacter sp. alg1]